MNTKLVVKYESEHTDSFGEDDSGYWVLSTDGTEWFDVSGPFATENEAIAEKESLDNGQTP